MKKYELMFIVKTTIESDKINNTIETYKKLITNSKGEIIFKKDMGQRKLAYPINKETNGNYYVIDFTSNAETLSELDRKLGIDENIIRHLIIKLEEE